MTHVDLPLRGEDAATPESLTLYALGGGKKLGVFTSEVPGDVANSDCAEIGSAGPDRMLGASRRIGSQLVRFAARDVADIREFCKAYPGSLKSATVIAQIKPSPVPGMGSLPLAISSVAYLTSYVSVGASEQRSVALGTMKDPAGYRDVLEWWIGVRPHETPGGLDFMIDSYAVQEGSVAPKAHLYLFEGKGNLLLLRTAGLDAGERRRILKELLDAK